jgi:hypothetical protein
VSSFVLSRKFSTVRLANFFSDIHLTLFHSSLLFFSIGTPTQPCADETSRNIKNHMTDKLKIETRDSRGDRQMMTIRRHKFAKAAQTCDIYYALRLV